MDYKPYINVRYKFADANADTHFAYFELQKLNNQPCVLIKWFLQKQL